MYYQNATQQQGGLGQQQQQSKARQSLRANQAQCPPPLSPPPDVNGSGSDGVDELSYALHTYAGGGGSGPLSVSARLPPANRPKSAAGHPQSLNGVPSVATGGRLGGGGSGGGNIVGSNSLRLDAPAAPAWSPFPLAAAGSSTTAPAARRESNGPDPGPLLVPPLPQHQRQSPSPLRQRSLPGILTAATSAVTAVPRERQQQQRGRRGSSPRGNPADGWMMMYAPQPLETGSSGGPVGSPLKTSNISVTSLSSGTMHSGTTRVTGRQAAAASSTVNAPELAPRTPRTPRAATPTATPLQQQRQQQKASASSLSSSPAPVGAVPAGLTPHRQTLLPTTTGGSGGGGGGPGRVRQANGGAGRCVAKTPSLPTPPQQRSPATAAAAGRRDPTSAAAGAAAIPALRITRAEPKPRPECEKPASPLTAPVTSSATSSTRAVRPEKRQRKKRNKAGEGDGGDGPGTAFSSPASSVSPPHTHASPSSKAATTTTAPTTENAAVVMLPPPQLVSVPKRRRGASEHRSSSASSSGYHTVERLRAPVAEGKGRPARKTRRTPGAMEPPQQQQREEEGGGTAAATTTATATVGTSVDSTLTHTSVTDGRRDGVPDYSEADGDEEEEREVSAPVVSDKRSARSGGGLSSSSLRDAPEVSTTATVHAAARSNSRSRLSRPTTPRAVPAHDRTPNPPPSGAVATPTHSGRGATICRASDAGTVPCQSPFKAAAAAGGSARTPTAASQSARSAPPTVALLLESSGGGGGSARTPPAPLATSGSQSFCSPASARSGHEPYDRDLFSNSSDNDGCFTSPNILSGGGGGVGLVVGSTPPLTSIEADGHNHGLWPGTPGKATAAPTPRGGPETPTLRHVAALSTGSRSPSTAATATTTATGPAPRPAQSRNPATASAGRGGRRTGSLRGSRQVSSPPQRGTPQGGSGNRRAHSGQLSTSPPQSATPAGGGVAPLVAGQQPQFYSPLPSPHGMTAEQVRRVKETRRRELYAWNELSRKRAEGDENAV